MKKLLALLVIIAGLGITSQVHANTDDNPYVYLNDVEDPSTVEEIQMHLTVYDVIDGDITDNIYVMFDNYTGNEAILGDFVVVYGVEDSSGQVSTTAITVRNKDVRAPVIEFLDEDELNIPHNAVLENKVPRIKALDSYDGDLTHIVQLDGFDSIDTSVLGTYPVTYTVSDESGNTTTLEVDINIVDVTHPTITAPAEIYKRADYILDADFFMQYVSASDDIDGNLLSSVEITNNGYIGNANKKGNYPVTLSVRDAAGNVTTHEIMIRVRNDMEPYLVIDKYHWHIPNDMQVTHDGFITILKYLGDLPNYTYVYNEVIDTYTSNYQENGSYSSSFELLSSTGNEYERELDITVVNPNENVIEEDPGVLDVAWGWFKILAIPVLVTGLFIYGLVKKG